MARPKKQQAPASTPAPTPNNGYTVEQGANGMWLVRYKGTPQRTFRTEDEAIKFVDYLDRVK